MPTSLFMRSARHRLSRLLSALLVGPLLGWGVTACKREPAPSSDEPRRASANEPSQPARDEHPIKRRRGGLDATFYVTADTHFGYRVPKHAPADRDVLAAPLGIEKVHRIVLDTMKRMPGRAYPPAIGGNVGDPLGVLVAGDLTESGEPQQWQAFLTYYGSLPGLPLYEAVGNHDFWAVRELSIKRHGALWYAWDWGDLHVICLGEAPGAKALVWLEQDLARLEADVPVVVFMHFPLLGAYSDTWFTREHFDDKLHDALRGHNVAGIFHGHYHGSGRYRWRGHDVFNVGSAKHDAKSFAVVHVTDHKLSVASWDYSRGAWEWWQDKDLSFGALAPKPAPR